jgi:hypothetical protein
METYMVLTLVSGVILAFFAYQWWVVASKQTKNQRSARKKNELPGAETETTQQPLQAPPSQESYPVVAGQTEQELRAKEPAQRRTPPSQQQPVTHEGHGPAEFEGNLRHPEQLFHQPQGTPSMTVSDVPSGRASAESTPGAGHSQPFSPELAQNGGVVVGHSVFAYDGSEPTGYSSF